MEVTNHREVGFHNHKLPLTGISPNNLIQLEQLRHPTLAPKLTMANQWFKTIAALITSSTTREAVAIMEGATESADHRLLVLKIRTTKEWETWAVCITNQITVSKGLSSTLSPKLTTKLNFASTSCKECVLTMKNAASPTARQS